jgi:hypothetical protein
MAIPLIELTYSAELVPYFTELTMGHTGAL